MIVTFHHSHIRLKNHVYGNPASKCKRCRYRRRVVYRKPPDRAALIQADRIIFVWGGLALLGLSLLTIPRTEWWATALLANFHLHLAVAGAAILAFGLVWRRWWQSAIGAAVVAANLALAAGPMPAPAAAAPPGHSAIRVMTLNVLFANRDAGALRRRLEELRPDIVLLQEVNRRWDWDLALFRDLYPHRVTLTRARGLLDAHGTVVLSKLPIGETARPKLGGLPGRLTAARIAVDGQSIWFASAHLVKPNTPGGEALQREQLRDLAAWAESVSGPLVIGGDFNATVHMPQMEELVSRDGFATDLGAGGWWPVARGTFPAWLPVLGLKIDHVLVREAFIAAAAVEEVPGSDHRGIVADLILPEGERS